MYKIKNSYIDKMMEAKLTSCEIDFILYIAGYQDDYGRVYSVYYKDICEKIFVSTQKFYDILTSLATKGLISYEKINRADFSVQLIGNSFADQNFSGGYIKTKAFDFQSAKFRTLKAGSKLLYLYMQRFTKGKRVDEKSIYHTFAALLCRSKKSIREYIRELKAEDLLNVSRTRSSQKDKNAYIITLKVMDEDELNIGRAKIPREIEGVLNSVKNLIRVNFRRFLPKQDQESVLDDIAGLIRHKEVKNTDFTVLVRAVELALEKQKEEGKKHPVVKPALVNKMLPVAVEQRLMQKFKMAY
ncbi:MAG: hypothetical protein MSA09_00150 [Lachnospiraceae bacterium]|nr:hypothetical protein [Lachnospiraceae bacterium]